MHITNEEQRKEMLESVYQHIPANPFILYLALLAIPFIENIFPPSPSDVLIVIGGTLITHGTICFLPALGVTSLGSELGFLLLFYLGKQTDKKLIQHGKLQFLNGEALKTAEVWFQKYGYTIILFNRFISGIRSVISYFAGISNLPVKRTVILSSISSILWHAVLLSLGMFFGNHVALIDHYLNIYGNIITVLIVAAAVFFGVKYWLSRRKSAK